jgi:hypothetical protein
MVLERTESLKQESKPGFVDVAVQITDEKDVRGCFSLATDKRSLLGVIVFGGIIIGTVLTTVLSFVACGGGVDGCNTALFASSAVITCRMVLYDGVEPILSSAGAEVEAVKIRREDLGLMVLECGEFVRLCRTRRACGSEELRALNDQIVVYCEALLVWRFADQDLKGLGEVIGVPAVDPVSYHRMVMDRIEGHLLHTFRGRWHLGLSRVSFATELRSVGKRQLAVVGVDESKQQRKALFVSRLSDRPGRGCAAYAKVK